ncbi:MAG: hypothetical protein IPK52_08095 [Chloroflexi bacterium]|nr:hypothetical protein [Chloroflexota bacterium]
MSRPANCSACVIEQSLRRCAADADHTGRMFDVGETSIAVLAEESETNVRTFVRTFVRTDFEGETEG